jgi:hypothetical protein
MPPPPPDAEPTTAHHFIDISSTFYHADIFADADTPLRFHGHFRRSASFAGVSFSRY